MYRIFLTIFMLMFSSAYPQDKVVKTLSMEQAVKEALVKKPSIQAFNYTIKSYRQQQKTTLSSFLPSVALNETAYNRQNALNLRNQIGVQVNQTVIDLSQIDNYKIYGSYIDQTQHEKEGQIDQVQLNTETAFLHAWLLQQKYPLIALLFNAAKATFNQAQHQYTVNLIDKNTWLTAKATYASSLATVNSYKDDIATAEKTLEYYIQSPIKLLLPTQEVDKEPNFPTTLQWNYEREFAVEPFDVYYQKALTNRKDLMAQQDVINEKAHESRYYAKQYLPTVGLFGNVTRLSPRPQGPAVIAKSAGISVDWNIMDGLSNYFKKSAADADKLAATLNKNDLKNQIKLDVQTAYSNLQQGLKQLMAQKASFVQSSNQFELNTVQFKTGLSSPVDYETAKYNYENARVAYVLQIANTTIQERNLLYACGYPK